MKVFNRVPFMRIGESGAGGMAMLVLGLLLGGCMGSSKPALSVEEGPITPPAQTPPVVEQPQPEQASDQTLNEDPMQAPELEAPDEQGKATPAEDPLPPAQVHRNPTAPPVEEKSEPVPNHATIRVP